MLLNVIQQTLMIHHRLVIEVSQLTHSYGPQMDMSGQKA